jgi:hypothetical protein
VLVVAKVILAQICVEYSAGTDVVMISAVPVYEPSGFFTQVGNIFTVLLSVNLILLGVCCAISSGISTEDVPIFGDETHDDTVGAGIFVVNLYQPAIEVIWLTLDCSFCRRSAVSIADVL